MGFVFVRNLRDEVAGPFIEPGIIRSDAPCVLFAAGNYMETVLSSQLQMEKLPSREAITEMISWMNGVDQQTAGRDARPSLSSASQVRSRLQKYKVMMQKGQGPSRSTGRRGRPGGNTEK